MMWHAYLLHELAADAEHGSVKELLLSIFQKCLVRTTVRGFSLLVYSMLNFRNLLVHKIFVGDDL